MLRKLIAAVMLLPGTALAQTALENGSAVAIPNTGAGTVNDPRTYTLVVPNNMDELRVILTGGSGDADLYVNFDEPWLGGSDPDANPDCESLDPAGPEESCTITNPLPGTWYIQVDAVTDYGGGVQLVAVAAVELADDVDETPISGADGDMSWYFIEVPASQGHLNVTTTGGNGNPNLNVGPNLFAGPECSSGSANTEDSCEIDQPAAGTWFVQITGTDAYSGVTLNAEYGPERPPNAGDVSSGPMMPLTLGGLLLAGLVAAARRRASLP
jgi:vibriolysin